MVKKTLKNVKHRKDKHFFENFLIEKSPTKLATNQYQRRLLLQEKSYFFSMFYFFYGSYEKSRTIEVAAKKKKSEKPQIQASLKLLLILAA